MGQQQLLLIVVGVIIVGIAVAIGITMFTESAAQANFEAITADMIRIASNAQQWYMKPGSMGGGGRTFSGMTFTKVGVNPSNGNGAYAFESIQPNQFNIRGIGVEDGDNDGSPATIVLTVFPDSVSNSPQIVSR